MFRYFFQDFKASINVFFISIPLCLGVAVAANAPVQAGIISGIIGGIVVGLCSGSHVNVSGPSPAMIATIYSAMLHFKDYRIFLCALFLSGIIQIIIGIIKLGRFGRYVPLNVINGLLFAVGAILIFNQFPVLIGYSTVSTGDFDFFKTNSNDNTLKILYHAISHLDLACTIIGFISILIVLFYDKISKKFKTQNIGSLIVVIFGIVSVIVLNYIGDNFSTLPLTDKQLVQLPVFTSSISGRFFDLIMHPNFSYLCRLDVLYIAVIIGLIGSVESILSTEAGDKLDKEKRHTSLNRELLAQGAGNVVAGLLGGIPITALVLRTSVNINAGAKTKSSAIINGFLLFLAVLLIPNILNQVPLAALAAVLIMSGIKLIIQVDLKKIYKRGHSSFIPFGITVATIFFTNLLEGVLFGLIASAFFVLKSHQKNPFKSMYDKYSVDEAIRIKLPRQVSFLNKITFVDLIKSIPANSTVMIDAEECQYIDYDILDIIKDFNDFYAPNHNIKVTLNGFLEKYEIKNSPFIATITKEQQEKMTPDQVLEWMIAGNKRFINGEHIYHSIIKQRQSTATQGQHPMAVILSCIDSRSAPELIFDLGIGDAVSIRIAGNIVNEDIISSIEFSCKELGTKLIVVLGHTACGAINAVCDGYSKNVARSILDKINPIVAKVKDYIPKNILGEEVIKMNVINSTNLIEKSAIIKEMIDSKEIKIVSAVYNIATGVVEFI